MKLKGKAVKYLINRDKEGMESSRIAIGLHVSKRRVNQIWREYSETGEIPQIGKNPAGRKRV